MVENVAVKHPHPRAFIEEDGEAHGAVDRHVHGVSPLAHRRHHSVHVQHLKKEAMQVKGMIPFEGVLDGPQLAFAERRHQVRRPPRRHAIDAHGQAAVGLRVQGQADVDGRRAVQIDGRNVSVQQRQPWCSAAPTPSEPLP